MVEDAVLIGVDPHKASNTLVVMDPVSETVITKRRFVNSAAGYRQLMMFTNQWRGRRWAVEGCHGAGRSLAQRLVADGEPVVDVPAKLAARIRVFSKGHGRKTDVDDAVSVAVAALRGEGVFPVQADGTMASLRLVTDRREELVALRTQAVCRLHRLLAELTPGGMTRRLSAGKVEALPPKLRPRDATGRIRLQLAEAHLEDIRVLDAKLKTVRAQITALVATTSTHLPDLYGVGPVIAGRIIAEVEDIGRFPSKDHFASYNGTAPIDASSGEQVRHRLSRAGNRRINHALHMMAVTQIRQPNTIGRRYYERKRLEGKTPKEALRCLTRRLSDVIYWQLVAERRARIGTCGSPTTTRRTRSTSSSPTSRSHPAAPASAPIPRPASKASSSWTGKTTGSLASKSSTRAKRSTTTSSTKQNPSNKHRLNQPAPGRGRNAPPAAAVKAGRRPPAGQRP
jgi:transposase